ncbi:MAG: Sec-independent protein translocase protein TatB [Plesiomonas sp.]
MFDIGFWELVLIAVIGLVVLGPERLPVAVRTVSRWVRTFRAMAASVQNELNQELKLQEMQENLKKAEQMNLKDLAPEVDASLRELKEAAASVQRPYATSTTLAESATQTNADAETEHPVSPAAKPSVLPNSPTADELAAQEEDESADPQLVAGLHASPETCVPDSSASGQRLPPVAAAEPVPTDNKRSQV